MQAAAAYNPYHHRPARRRQANPVGIGAAGGMLLGLGGAAVITYGLVKLIDRRTVLIPAIVTPSEGAKRFFQVSIGADGAVSLTGPTAAGVSTSGMQAQIVSPEQVDAIVSLPGGVGAQAEVGGSVSLVAQTAQDFVFRWAPAGEGDAGEAALVLVGPPVNGNTVPLGTVVISFRTA